MKDYEAYEAYEALADTILSSSARKGLVLWSDFPDLCLLDTEERNLINELIVEYGYIHDSEEGGVWSGFSLNDYGRLFITKGGYIGEKIRERDMIDYNEIKIARKAYRQSKLSLFLSVLAFIISICALYLNSLD